MRRLPLLVASLPLLAALAGCQNPLTEVVIVFQSDLVVPAEADSIQVAVAEGPFSPASVGAFFSGGGLVGDFPVSIGVTSAGRTSSFSITARLTLGFNSTQQPLSIVVDRTVTDIRFVDEQTMMLVVPLPRVCACQGTSCPTPGNPECDSIDRPALQPFDPAVAPPSTMMTGGIPTGVTPPPRAGGTP